MAKAKGLPRVAVVADMGHSLLKIAATDAAGRWDYEVAPHAIQHITNVKEWQRAAERTAGQTNAADYIQIGQHYYIIGDSAERYGHSGRQLGAARYVREYIGVQAIAMLARVCPHDEAEVIVLALHPPSDAEYRKELRRALKGTWDMMTGDGRELLYNVTQVITLDEPVAGFMNIAITDHLKENTNVTGGEVLVLDVGGGTTSVAPVLPSGAVDYLRIDSHSMGILDVMSKLQSNLRDHYRDFLMKARAIPMNRLRDALKDNQLKAGGRTLNCTDDVRSAKAELLSEIERMYRNGRIGGPYGFDMIVLTGGGSVALGGDLEALLDHTNIRFAARASEIHLANLFGGMKVMARFIQDGTVTL